MKKLLPMFAALVLSIVLLLHPPKVTADASGDMAVVVNKLTAVVSLTSNDLKAIYLGEKAQWPNGQRITAIMLAPTHPESKVLLKSVCGMSEGDFKKFFIQASFTGKTLSPPRVADSPASVKAIVSKTPGAIGVIRAADADATVNIVKVDGGAPGDPSYKLTGN